MPADQYLLLLLRQQPERGLKMLMDSYMGLVYTIVAGKLQNAAREDIEEVAADIFFEFYHRRDEVDLKAGSVKACLAALAQRRAIDRYRALARGAGRELPLTAAELPADSAEQPEQQAAARELLAALLAAVNALGWPDSEIFIRRYYFGQGSRAIAAAFNLRVNTVDKKISRGLAKLKQAIGGEL